mgnify:CR=1 FL=1
MLSQFIFFGFCCCDNIFGLTHKSLRLCQSFFDFSFGQFIPNAPFKAELLKAPDFSLKDLDGKTTGEVYEILLNLENESIYDGKRLALPDEVWNFRRGDGIEKALLLAGIIINRGKGDEVNKEKGKGSGVLSNRHFKLHPRSCRIALMIKEVGNMDQNFGSLLTIKDLKPFQGNLRRHGPMEFAFI